ncbi:toxin-antitoxin system YwqK family antitoxin [Rufibacter glacialis]|uniref:Toxin-antitoxin system YwqK family antitoxin n=1 Tax=Rufibacter glacialis TaxID=1259555 RepID=A0A5M8QE72_9BACT|nr:hypothetical protein [Rufibacter glacialis]KAA6433488.1 hypothetical protein FOE74_13560 [Rufibacter glacialis]GGK73761.1 hypothetical protein GCM10011405_22280 [Rufibacter glacialis]
MKPFLLLVILLIFTFTLQAQKSNTKQIIPLTTDTVYFDQDWERTHLREDIKYARIIKRTVEGVPYGTVRNFYYPSWKKQWEGKLLSEDPDVPFGLCTSWYPNGKVKSIATYKDGEAQEDIRMWHENGTKITCTYKFIDALPLTRAKLHSFFNPGSSRKVISIDLPANAHGIVFKIDLRDEGEPAVDWATASTLASLSMLGGANDFLFSGAKALSRASSNQTRSTTCHYFITTSLEDANHFERTKGEIPDKNSSIWKAKNVPQDTRQLSIPKDAKTLYFCINNDNLQTSAEATLSVSVLQKQCK